MKEWVIAHEVHHGIDMYRGELWCDPFTGLMLACTCWRRYRAVAVRDAQRYLNVKNVRRIADV